MCDLKLEITGCEKLNYVSPHERFWFQVGHEHGYHTLDVLSIGVLLLLVGNRVGVETNPFILS